MSLYLPWGISHYAIGDQHFEYWIESGVGTLVVGAVFTAGLGVLPVAISLALFCLALWKTQSRALAWICRVLLLIALGALVWATLRPEHAVVRRHLSEWQLFLGRCGRYVALLIVLTAIAFEISSLVRPRVDVEPSPRGQIGSAPIRSEDLHRAAVSSAIAIPFGLLLLCVVATALEIVGVSWDLHFNATALVVILVLLVPYANAIVRVGKVGRQAPESQLAAAVGFHAVAQVAAGMSVLIVGAPLAGTGEPLVPPDAGSIALSALWVGLLVSALRRSPRLAARWRIRLLLAVLAMAVVAHPLLSRSVVQTTMQVQLLIAGTGWAVMQLLALTHWAQSRSTSRGSDALLTVLPPAACVLVVVVGLTVLHASLAFENIRM